MLQHNGKICYIIGSVETKLLFMHNKAVPGEMAIWSAIKCYGKPQNKELFKNAPPYIDNITLKYNIQLRQILYPIKTNTIYSEDKYNIQ